MSSKSLCVSLMVISYLCMATKLTAEHKIEKKISDKTEDVANPEYFGICQVIEESPNLFLVELELANGAAIDPDTGFNIIIKDKRDILIQNTMMPSIIKGKASCWLYISSNLIVNSEISVLFELKGKSYSMEITFRKDNSGKMAAVLHVKRILE